MAEPALPSFLAAPLIEAHGLGLTLGGRPILQHIDLDVAPGEIVTLIGPNGAGKTMLIRLLLGLTPPDAGNVRRRDGLVVGYLPQKTVIDSSLPMTARRLLSLARPIDAATADGHLAEVGASGLADRMIHDLSGGELQRVLLARALLREPELLVLDEPVQGVDFSGEIELYDLITRIRKRRGCGVLLVSHDLHLVMASTDRVVCLNGHVCCSGKPEAVSRHPEYLSLFGPQAVGGLAVYAHAHDHHHELSGEVVVDSPDDTAGHPN